MSQHDNEDCSPRSPDELRAVFPKATPTPSLSQGSPSASPPNRRAGNPSKTQTGSLMGDAVLLKSLGVPLVANESSIHMSEGEIKSLSNNNYNNKEAFRDTSSLTPINSKKWEDVWRKDNRRPSQELKKTSSAYTSPQKPIGKSVIDASIAISSTIPNGSQPRPRYFPSQLSASKSSSSMNYSNSCLDNRLPSIRQLDQVVKSGASQGINETFDSRGNSSMRSSLRSTTSKTIIPPQLPPICSFPRHESSSTSESSYSPSEQNTRHPSISSVSTYNPRPSYLNGHTLQPIDGVQPLTPSLSSAHSGSESFSGTDSYSPETLPSPADSTHASSQFARETIFPQIRHQDDNYSRLASSDSKGYKCTYAGCNAPSFQTQYLLNSHRNVHSQDRPYFCEAPGCGKGFKRKNELKRHGLSHESPGYVCPFCPDRDHRYPRPDNLQRHVKGHHNDKQNDPLLRDILSRRSDSINSQGRRRRSGVYQG